MTFFSENIPRVATPDLVRHSSNRPGPWGKPGAGAPLKDDEGNVVKNTKGTIDKEQKNISQSEASMRARAKEIYRYRHLVASLTVNTSQK